MVIYMLVFDLNLTERTRVSVIDDLLALQEHDETIRELEGPVKDIPTRCALEQKKIDSERVECDRAVEEVQRLKIACRDDELTISELKETVLKFKIQSATLKTNAECAAMNAQIAKAEDNLKMAEVRKAANELATEKGQSYLDECQKRLEETEKEVGEYITSLQERLADIQVRLDTAMVERASKVEPLDVPATKRFLMYYERLRKNRWPVLIHLHENVCTGCHMSLPPSKQQQAAKNLLLANDPAKMTIVACDFCGRIVY